MSKTGTKTGDAGTAEGGKTGTTESSTSSTAFETYDAFYDAQPEGVRKLIDDHVSGLRNAHERTKEERNELRTALADLKKAGSPEDFKARIESAEKRSRDLERSTRFYESDLAKKLTNPKLALGIARQEELLNDDGTLRDAGAFEKQFPELFAKPEKTPPHRPGEGSGSTSSTGQEGRTMDDLIRGATGRVTVPGG